MALSANEFKIGIILNRKHGKGWTETIIDEEIMGKLFTDSSLEYAINDFEPIPLTEEWLLKFGFFDTPVAFQLVIFGDSHKQMCLDLKCKQDGKDRLTSVSFDTKLGLGFEIKFEYVHQLQNLYFALTGQELIIQ